MAGDQEDGAGDRRQRSGERIIEFGPSASDALEASLRVFAKLGMVIPVEKVDGSLVEVVPVLVDGGQALGAKRTSGGGQFEETVCRAG